MISQEQAIEAAFTGLDFFVRHQISPSPDNDDLLTYDSADLGRFPLIYNVKNNESVLLSCNWINGVVTDAMLLGYGISKRQEYLKAAKYSISYIKSLQYFSPNANRLDGVIREWTPQTNWAHPRDALTAALALLDWYKQTNEKDAFIRAIKFADWFLKVGMEQGYPYWTVRFDEKPWAPTWYGSFHSGSAFFFYRLFDMTSQEKYKQAMLQILKHYNNYHLKTDGSINVIINSETYDCLDGKFGLPFTSMQWETMHKYNDDFGALANLAAYKVTKETQYRDAAECFLKAMLMSQRPDGGFGPKDYSVPSAAGIILIELITAQRFGIQIANNDQIETAIRYLLDIQVNNKNIMACGAFLDNENETHARTSAYAIMALFRYAGIVGDFYFLTV